MFLSQSRRPLYVIALTVCFTVSFLTATDEADGFYLALVAVVFLAVTVCIPRLRRVGVVYLLCFGVVMGALCTYLYHAAVVKPLQALDDATAQITARIVAVPESGEEKYTLVVTDSNRVPQGTRLAVSLTSENVRLEKYGIVQGNVSLYVPNSSYSRGDGIFLAGSMQVISQKRGEPRWHERLSDRLRTGLLEGIFEALPAQEAAFVAGVCVGDKTSLSADTIEDFRKSGLSHLMVVSGLHMTVFSGAVMGVLKLLRVRRCIATVISLAVLWAFMFVVGFSFSVIRAAVMLHCLLIGNAFRRRADSRTSLAVALLLIVGSNPYAICDVGFLLSFTATWGIVVLYPLWDKFLTSVSLVGKRPWIGKLCAPLGVALAAMLSTAPVLVSAFGSIAVLSPLANVLTGEAVGVLLPLAISGGVLYQITFLRIPARLCLWGAGLLARWIMAVAGWIAELSVNSLRIRQPVWLFLLVLLPFAIRAAAGLRGKRGVLGVLTASAVAVVGILGVFHSVYRDTAWIRVANAGYSTTVVVESRQGTVAFISGQDAFSCERARQYILSCGIASLDALVVTDSTVLSGAEVQKLAVAIPVQTIVFPIHDAVDGLQDGVPLALTQTLTVATFEDWWLLNIGDTRVLFSPRGGLVSELPAEWQSTHLAVVRQSVPDDMEVLAVQHAVVICVDDHLTTVTEQLPQGRYPITMTAVNGGAVFATMGKGDLMTADTFWL